MSSVKDMSDNELDNAIMHWETIDLKFDLDRMGVIEILKEIKRMRKQLSEIKNIVSNDIETVDELSEAISEIKKLL